jgi:hypothetical protein
MYVRMALLLLLAIFSIEKNGICASCNETDSDMLPLQTCRLQVDDLCLVQLLENETINVRFLISEEDTVMPDTMMRYWSLTRLHENDSDHIIMPLQNCHDDPCKNKKGAL